MKGLFYNVVVFSNNVFYVRNLFYTGDGLNLIIYLNLFFYRSNVRCFIILFYVSYSDRRYCRNCRVYFVLILEVEWEIVWLFWVLESWILDSFSKYRDVVIFIG